MARALVVFLAVAIVHFALSIAGFLLVLPAAFETQGVGFWAAPGKMTLVAIASVLLAPVAWIWGSAYEFPHVAAVSALFGAAAVLLMRLWADARRRCAARPS
jgi:hypothetical protein